MGKKFNSSSDVALIGAQIRQARMSQGLTLVDLGRAVNVHHSQISRYERGYMSSAGKNLHKICTFLQIKDDPREYSTGTSSLGRKVDELLRVAPECEPAVAKLVEALEELIAGTHPARMSPDSSES
ncbi:MULTISPECIES: helix-turn-helix domain-containing protein [unclassified Pseudomonas]|uniref:helix-turn-helix domain-containing protein n=1 Tax=unclassified Pseudomonas TaxID=196821 RepID=UPI0021139E35|nr:MULTISPECIES: helix-turn-helix transcriptional regulator [unclassified Pseudomonas]MDU7557683.1 helix-turn-helix transcriptional regulator [Pseudomonas sp.]